MYKIIYFLQNLKHEVFASTLEECFSICVDLYNQNAELTAIEKNGKCLYLFGEIYKKIKRAIY